LKAPSSATDRAWRTPPITLVVPGRLDTRTGGYLYDRRVIEGLRARGWQVAVRELEEGYPFPSTEALRAAADALAAIPDDSIVLVDGLAFGAMPDVVASHATRVRFVPIVHLPLAEDPGLDADTARLLRAGETRALQAADAIIATGPSTRATLIDYGIAPRQIVVAEPGTDEAPLARGSDGDRLELLCVATINPGKGHATLVRALASAPHRKWHLTCAGSLTRHPAAVVDLRRQIADAGLSEQITLAGELDSVALERAYDRADLFVLPTLKETFGMAIAEAIARGLPVISTRTGAIPDIVGDAGLLVRPGDERAFTDALHRVLGDDGGRRRLAAGAKAARQRLRPWDLTLDKIESALHGLTRHPAL